MRGVTFGNYHTWDDWGLLLSSFPMIEPPTPQSKTISVPARDGQINLSRALDGHIHYNSRKVTFKFLCKDKRDRWTEVYSQMLSVIQGQQIKVVLDDIPDCYLYGVFQLEKPTYKDKYCIFTVTGVCDPYMYLPQIKDTVVVSDSTIRTIQGTQMPIRPVFKLLNGEVSVEYEQKRYALTVGKDTIIPEIYIDDGVVGMIVFKGNGNVELTTQGGKL